LTENRMLVPEATGIATQIARGLAAAHERGVVHCDVKPANIFVMRDGRVKILDFGVARLTADAAIARGPDSVATGRFAGTPAYSFPEQIRGDPLDARSDIFSLDCVLYEMLAGRPPFDGPSVVEIGYAVLQSEPEPLPANVPAQLQRIVGRCLEKDPAKRFQSAKDLAFDLDGVIGRSPPVRHRRWWTSAVLSAVGIGIGAAIVLLVPRRGPAPPSFRQMTFLGGAVWSARFGSDSRAIRYTEALDGEPSRIIATRATNPDYQRVDARGSVLLALSPGGDVALLTNPQFRTFDFSGTLAVIPAGGGAPREIAEHVDYADWSPDGSSLAI